MEQREICQAIRDAGGNIAAQIEDLRHEIIKSRKALESMAEYLPSLTEALRNIYELVEAVDRLREMQGRVARPGAATIRWP